MAGRPCWYLYHQCLPAGRDDEAARVAVARGVTFFETAEVYGPFTNGAFLAVRSGHERKSGALTCGDTTY
jgi:aryl-alcohol dehydrogenase-like predicted oxidoreductase